MYKAQTKQDEYIKVFSRRRVLKRKIGEYADSFTIHGLTKIVNGNKVEKIIWSSILICAIMAALYLTYGFIKKYHAHAIYIDMHSIIDDRALHPSVTFCLSNYLHDYKSFYCGYPLFQHPTSEVSCNRNNISHSKQLPQTERFDAIWSNGVFHFTDCYADIACGQRKYFRTAENTNGACVTWNWNNTLFQIYNKAKVEFEIDVEVFTKFHHQPTIDVIVHHHEIKGEFQNPQIQIISGLTYQLNIRKSVTKRLPAPFPSNCSDKKPNSLFPGKYNRHTCIALDFDLKTYERCGGLKDFPFVYISPNVMHLYQQNRSILNVTNCFLEENIERYKADCPVACSETNYDVTSFVIPLEDPTSLTKVHAYSVEIGYQTSDSYQIMEEKELYPWDKFASEFGGLIGLLIGASLFSVVEIFVYLLLCCIRCYT